MYKLDYKDHSQNAGIYKITNVINNLSYIGSAVNLKARLQRHHYDLINKRHNNLHLQRSFELNGLDAFIVEILEEFEFIKREDLLKIEESYIVINDSIRNGFNQILNNSLHFGWLNKQKDHINSNNKINSKPIFVFNRFSGEREFEFDSISDCAKYLNLESTNISQCCKKRLRYLKNYTFCYKQDFDENNNYICNSHWAKDKPMNPNHRERLTNININRLGKKIYKYDLNYNLIEIYASRSIADRENGFKTETLRWQAGKNTPYMGFYWFYQEYKHKL